jgi:hypothetical protein
MTVRRRIFAHIRTESKLRVARIPAFSRSPASLASGAGMTKMEVPRQALAGGSYGVIPNDEGNVRSVP